MRVSDAQLRESAAGRHGGMLQAEARLEALAKEVQEHRRRQREEKAELLGYLFLYAGSEEIDRVGWEDATWQPLDIPMETDLVTAQNELMRSDNHAQYRVRMVAVHRAEAGDHP